MGIETPIGKANANTGANAGAGAGGQGGAGAGGNRGGGQRGFASAYKQLSADRSMKMMKKKG